MQCIYVLNRHSEITDNRQQHITHYTHIAHYTAAPRSTQGSMGCFCFLFLFLLTAFCFCSGGGAALSALSSQHSAPNS
jgi:hypothetical protein